MKTLWINDSGLNTNEIKAACDAASAYLASIDVTIDEADEAIQAMAEGEDFNAAHADAWRYAELAAFNMAFDGYETYPDAAIMVAE